MLSFENVYFAYESEKWVLEDINFALDKGEFVSIIGSNGSGKSTIARLANGLLLSSKGKVLLDGNDLSGPYNRTAKFKVGLVFQNPDNQFVGITVEDDIAFGLENLGLERSEIQKRIMDISDEFGIKTFLHFPPNLLSGGEKQKVALASVLVLEPDYLIFDEVTSLLDPLNRKEILKVIMNISKEKGVLYITHHPEETVFSNKIVVLHNGKIVKVGAPKEVFYQIDLLASIGVSNINEALLAKQLLDSGIVKNFSINLDDILNQICLN